MGARHRDAPARVTARTLLVSNDFPPRPGGIQSYLYEIGCRLPPDRLVAYVPDWPGASDLDRSLPFPVVRHPGPLMLPVPDVARRARRIAREHGCDTVWFGAAAPLGLFGPVLRRGGVDRVVASTHGHEVGWAMTPGGRAALRRVGRGSDVVTVVSRYTRRRLAAVFGPLVALEHLPPGVDTAAFRPDPGARAEIRRRYRLGQAPVVGCVSRLVPRKGQDVLVRALPEIRRRVPGAVLLLVGDGRYRGALQRLARGCGVDGAVRCTGSVPWAELPAHHATCDVFAMPCRTRGGGLDVEGLGIVLLEAAATGLPVVVGNSGGAPETVQDGATGHIVDGRDVPAVARTVAALLADPDRAVAMGAAGRDRMCREWRWSTRADRMACWLTAR